MRFGGVSNYPAPPYKTVNGNGLHSGVDPSNRFKLAFIGVGFTRRVRSFCEMRIPEIVTGGAACGIAHLNCRGVVTMGLN